MIGQAMLRWPASARLLLASHPITAPTSTLVLPLRTYATPGRPKSVVGEPSRPVKRAAVKPRQRVEMTEEQKAIQQERLEAAKEAVKARNEKKKAAAKARADKDRMIELKKLALEPPSTPAGNAYTSYTAEKIKEMGPVKDENGTSKVGDRMRQIAAQWKTLEPAEIEHYNHIARVKSENAAADYKRYVQSFTPDEIRRANSARRELNKRFPSKFRKGPKFPEIKDERIVTRPRNSFIQFATARFASGDFKNILARDRMQLIGAEWKALSAEEKIKYENLAKQDIARYVEEYKETYGLDAPVPKTKGSAAEATA